MNDIKAMKKAVATNRKILGLPPEGDEHLDLDKYERDQFILDVLKPLFAKYSLEEVLAAWNHVEKTK